jgi:hypothetical protein
MERIENEWGVKRWEKKGRKNDRDGEKFRRLEKRYKSFIKFEEEM